MGKVTYRERHFIDRYRCIDKKCNRWFDYYFEVPDTHVLYFRLGKFETFTLSKEDIIEIEVNGKSVKF